MLDRTRPPTQPATRAPAITNRGRRPGLCGATPGPDCCALSGLLTEILWR